MNLIPSYFNPSMSESQIIKGLKSKITSEASSIIWDYAELERNNRPLGITYSSDEIERVRQDFTANFNNLRKYPKMSEKDWE